jgi:hypothetical protein
MFPNASTSQKMRSSGSCASNFGAKHAGGSRGKCILLASLHTITVFLTHFPLCNPLSILMYLQESSRTIYLCRNQVDICCNHDFLKSSSILAHSLESRNCRIIHLKLSRSRVGALHFGFRCVDKNRVSCGFPVCTCVE